MQEVEQRPRILIVDDEIELCDTMALTFEMRGFDVLSAYNGKSAFEIIKEKPVDVILSDVRMANGSGVELAQWIRNANIQIPVIAFMSGYADITPKQISELGVALFFDKPFPVNTVIKTIRELLATLKK